MRFTNVEFIFHCASAIKSGNKEMTMKGQMTVKGQPYLNFSITGSFQHFK